MTTNVVWQAPETWCRVPIASPDAFVQWREELLGSELLADWDASVARRQLDQIRGYAELAGPNGAERGWFAVLDPVGSGGALVVAVGWVEVAPGPDPDAFLAASEQRAGGTGDSLPTMSELRTLGGRRTVVRHEFLARPTRDGGARVIERFASVGRDETTDLNIRMELSTSDLSAFEDLQATCCRALESLELTGTGQR